MLKNQLKPLWIGVICLAASATAQAQRKSPHPEPKSLEPQTEAIPTAEAHRFAHPTLGDEFFLLIFTDEPERAQSAAAAAFEAVDRLFESVASDNPDSDAARLNLAAGGDPVELSKDTVRMLGQAKQVFEKTNGAFAITSAPLDRLWNFQIPANQQPIIPSLESIESRLPRIDDNQIELAENTARLTQATMAVDLGELAKGKALDRALEVVFDLGFDQVMAVADGDIAARGLKGSRPWVVGLQEPRAEGFFAVLPLKDEAVATRGDYQDYFELDGVRYHSLIDPRTGFPAAETRSVSVVCNDAVLASAYAAAVFVLGPDAGLALVEADDQIETVIVNRANQVIASSGLADRLRILHQPAD